ncbi:MAG TPA: DUF4834 family protein [Paludibacteraceae bacterium]|nr:DUF4834 family protein [Paludibacteraceae bacterium]HOL01052.1 DUF4834 family protein [Paludibacteraceae bacterium]HPC26832.1 DUF4834 family protein [Paludibacteraceae bacterium]HPO68118.1 DUF4834 family protein [Paludibacteraceae bacterium]HRU63158.1 DUF4834 family protein [Paludibacteraceae bacterium]
MNLIFSILIFLLFFFLFGVIVLFGFFRSLFNFRGKGNKIFHHRKREEKPIQRKEKIFDKNEGEYVDFEEIE